MAIFDIHNHTNFSHDAKQSIDELVDAAKNAGLSGVAVTDHCDIEFYRTIDVRGMIKASVTAANEAKGRALEKGIKLFAGVELGEALFDPEAEKEMHEFLEYDVVLASVHAVRGADTTPFASLDFSTFSLPQVKEYIGMYFDDLIEMSQRFDYDVLSHLNVVFRYPCGKYGFEVDINDYTEKIEAVLKTVIARDKCLEVNTSDVFGKLASTLPGEGILKLYRDLGGKHVSIGGDAHISANVGRGSKEAREMLIGLGFTEGCYFENRVMKKYAF